MYQLLICEDDDFIASSLKNLLKSISKDIDNIYITANGEEALAVFEENHIDLLITDMQMPIMNGVELVNKLRKAQYNCKIIVLSGFSDFDYAQSVIKHDICEYLLKPITRKKLEATVQHVFDELKSEYSKELYVEALELKLEEQLPVLIEKYLYEACYGTINLELSRLLGLDKISNLKLLVMSINTSDQKKPSTDLEKNKQLSLLYTLEKFQISFKDLIEYKTFTVDSHLCVLMFGCLQISNDSLEKNLKQFQNEIKDSLIQISFGISSTFSDLSKMNQSYRDAIVALNYNQYYGSDSIMFFDNIQFNPKNDIYMDISDIKNNIYKLLELSNYDVIEETLLTLKSKLIEYSCDMEYIKTLCIELISTINIFAYESNINLSKLIDLNQNPINKILNSKILDEQFLVITEVINLLISQLNRNSDNLIEQRIRQIKTIIHNNLADNLTLDIIAEQVFLTPNYIGTIFKQSTGESFKEYVKSAKIKKAKELLMTTQLKIYEISDAVGYKSVTYFSKKFKEVIGQLPSDYRQIHSNESKSR